VARRTSFAGGCRRGRMRRLLWTLASTDCTSASYMILTGRPTRAERFLVRAACLLSERARTRDPSEGWQPIRTQQRDTFE
jgi:hypothetical protein